MKKREEREKKKAEVRARLEASSVKANKKKGFMTPERKKKLRVSIYIEAFDFVDVRPISKCQFIKLLLRRKAAEELKRQQETKAAERRRVIAERTGEKKNTDNMNEGKLGASVIFMTMSGLN